MLHTAGLGFLVGVDIYDCVVVINTQKALDAFSKLRCTLGGEISAVAGPVGAGGMLETEIHKRQAPVFTYLKSRGFYAGIQIDGTIVLERTDENERFYGQKLSVGEIMAGKVRHPPYELKMLFETIKAAQGDKDVNEDILPSEPPPGDYEIEDSKHMFGVPDKEDPDPYGVLALEKEGFEIREAGTQKRASWEQFSFQPAPTSPLYSTFGRGSSDRDSRSIMTLSRQGSHKRDSNMSPMVNGAGSLNHLLQAEKRQTSMTDMSTQTDFPEPPSPGRSSVRSSIFSGRRTSLTNVPENGIAPPSPAFASPSAGHSPSPSHSVRANGSTVSGHRKSKSLSRSNSPPQAKASTPSPTSSPDPEPDHDHDADAEDTAEDTDAAIEEPVVHAVFQRAAAPQAISKARLVTVPKRVPPRLPPRNPNRKGPLVIGGDQAGISPVTSPTLGTSETGSVRSASPTTVRGEESVPSSPRPNIDVNATNAMGDVKAEEEVGGVRDRVEEMELVGGDVGDVTSGEETQQERDPWAKVMEKRRSSPDSVDVPGSFHSLPATPVEEEERKVGEEEGREFA